MSKQQQQDLIATLRQGGLDLGADVATMRVRAGRRHGADPGSPAMSITFPRCCGADAVDVTIRDIDTANTILYFHGGVYVIGIGAKRCPW